MKPKQPRRAPPQRAPRAPAAPPALQQRKHDLVRDAIWDAAMDLFASRGFDATTVDEIARAAGVSRRSLFRYFSSKRDLMAQGVVSYAHSLAQAIDACPPGCPPAEAMRKTVFQVARQSAAHARTRQIMRIAAQCPAAREAQLARIAELQDLVAAAFARRPGMRPGDALAPRLLAAMTLSILGVIFGTWFDRGEEDISTAAQRVFASLERLLCESRKVDRRRMSRQPLE